MNYWFFSKHGWGTVQKIQHSKHALVGIFTAATSLLAVIVVSVSILAAQEIRTAAHLTPPFSIQGQAACETKMLRDIGAREVFSGGAYGILTEVSQEYNRAIPHMYIVPATINMVYIAGSTAADGRGKIVVGEQAIKLFDALSLKGFLGHEMAHLVSDTAAQGCDDYIIRDPRIEADADALAKQMLGAAPVEAFLERLLVLTQPQNWEAKQRLALLHTSQEIK